MEEASPHYTSLVNVHEDGGVRTKTHRRHQSLFSYSSAPMDLSSYPSMRSETSSTSLRKSASGSLNWKLGEFWSKLRAPLKQNKTLEKQTESDETPASVAEADTASSDTREKETEIDLGFQGSDETPDEAESKSKSLHFISLNLFGSSSTFSSSRDEIPIADDVPALESRWREVQGASHWRGLLTEPLDLDLRKELLRYGDFAQLANDTFENNTRSKYAGSARCSKQTLFHKRAFGGYEATRYLYATSERPLSLSSTPWDVDSTWIGYVAVATDAQEIARLGRRDIVVAWRGAGRAVEFLVDAPNEMVAVRIAGHPEVKVERAFWSLFSSKRAASQFNHKSASEQVITELQRLLALYSSESLSITVTGHNLGGALATLTAYALAHLPLPKHVPVTAFTFGSPPLGDAAFRKHFTDLQIPLLRVVNLHDAVPKCAFWSKHVGVELQVNQRISPYLRGSKEAVDWNDLEVYLHCVDGFQGKKFELVTGRDCALVNKYTDVLQESLCVSARWWVAENKGLVLGTEGRWVERERALEENPTITNHERFV